MPSFLSAVDGAMSMSLLKVCVLVVAMAGLCLAVCTSASDQQRDMLEQLGSIVLPNNKFPSADKKDLEEQPVYDSATQYEMYLANYPLNTPLSDSLEMTLLKEFAHDVALILLVTTDNAYQAAITFMEAPTAEFARPVLYPMPGMVVGMFAGKKTALVQGLPGELASKAFMTAAHAYSSAGYAIAVGGCYAFDEERYKLGDVIVSKQLADLQNFAYKNEGDITNHGQTINSGLMKFLCSNMIMPDFPVSDVKRLANVHCGKMISYPAAMKDKDERDKFHAAVPTSIAGEREGRVIMGYAVAGDLTGALVIKGVAHYGDGVVDQQAWEFTATMAALTYTKSKLINIAPDFD